MTSTLPTPDREGKVVRNYYEGVTVSGPRSPECRAKQAEAARRRWASEEARKEQSERLKEAAPWKGKTLSAEHRQAISDGGQGVSHDLSEEDRAALAERGRAVLDDVRNRPGYSERLAEGQRRRVARGDLTGFQVPGVWQKGYETRVANGTVIAPGAGRGITGFREGLGHYCRSTLEANFARVLVKEAVPYLYEPQVFRLPSGQRWTPDFFLLAPLKDLVPAGWVELKGWRKSDGTLPLDASLKIQSFEQLTGQSVFVLVQSDPVWKQIEAQWAQSVPWECPRYNLKTHPAVFGKRG